MVGLDDPENRNRNDSIDALRSLLPPLPPARLVLVPLKMRELRKCDEKIRSKGPETVSGCN